MVNPGEVTLVETKFGKVSLGKVCIVDTGSIDSNLTVYVQTDDEMTINRKTYGKGMSGRAEYRHHDGLAWLGKMGGGFYDPDFTDKAHDALWEEIEPAVIEKFSSVDDDYIWEYAKEKARREAAVVIGAAERIARDHRLTSGEVLDMMREEIDKWSLRKTIKR